jgi:hypothetical protein
LPITSFNGVHQKGVFSSLSRGCCRRVFILF